MAQPVSLIAQLKTHQQVQAVQAKPTLKAIALILIRWTAMLLAL